MLPLLVIPYHETISVTGVISEQDNIYTVTVFVQEQQVSKIWNSKMILHHKKYNVQVQELIYHDDQNQYQFILGVTKKQNIKIDHVPMKIKFELGKTTLLNKMKTKMKGWFL